MPLFSISSQRLTAVEQTNFSAEKLLQSLIERNLQTVFNCRLVASEFPTGAQHAGRIDTLALSEDDNPVIIEYKKVESSELINQSLFYLSWIHDHHGDFEIAVQKSLGNSAKVDWSEVRVICIAPHYRKYDVHAAQVRGANIELWTYRLYRNQTLHLEEVLQKSPSVVDASSGKNPIMVEAGKKAAITRQTGSYTFDSHLKNRPEKIKELTIAVHDFITGLDPSIETVPKKFYIAYKISQNIVCMETFSNKKLTLFLKLNPKEVPNPPKIARDVSRIGHYGTGDFEMTLKTEQDLEVAKPFIEMAYRKVGG